MRELKHRSEIRFCETRGSHPSWVRELKQCNLNNIFMYEKSHPSWVRELKLQKSDYSDFFAPVAPLVGA